VVIGFLKNQVSGENENWIIGSAAIKPSS